MTRKQYEGKMRQLLHNLERIGRANGTKSSHHADRVAVPTWGTPITYGRHDGEILTSYAQAWDMLVDILGITKAFEGIK